MYNLVLRDTYNSSLEIGKTLGGPGPVTTVQDASEEWGGKGEERWPIAYSTPLKVWRYTE